MAYEPRLRAGILTLSAGDFQKLVKESPYRGKLDKSFRAVVMVAPVVASLLKPFDPIYHVGRIAPRPLLFQNAVNDELLPTSAVQALYMAAGEPKKMVWYDSAHNRAERAILEQLVRDTFAWITQYDRSIVAGRKADVPAP
jgi:fermentation-respiration switch protein FrsA (DUF1100 family)